MLHHPSGYLRRDTQAHVHIAPFFFLLLGLASMTLGTIFGLSL
jgi:hypothetical protein